MRTFRKWLHRLSLRCHQPVMASHESVLRGVECLEPRCVLSSAPAAAGLSLELQLHEVPPFVLDDAPYRVSWEIAGAGGLDVLYVVGPIAAGGEVGVGAIAVRISPQFPVEDGVAYRFAKAAIMDYLWGDFSPLVDNWLDMPSTGLGGYWLPPSQTPSNPNPPGGYIDIGTTAEAAPSVPFIGNDTDQVSRQVLAMLTSLSYVPGDGRVEAVSPQPSSHPRGSAEWNQSDASAPHKPKATEFLATAATDDALPPAEATANPNLVDRSPSHDESSEGGMVALPRETVLDETFAESAAARVDVDALLSVPVQMERVSGRFQAFEVLSAEEASSAAPSPVPTNDSDEESPATDAAALPPETRSGTFDVDHLPADIAFVKFALPDGIRQNASTRASESSEKSGRAEAIGTSGDAKPQTAARVPREDEEEELKTSSLAKATVAAIAVATVVRVAAARSEASKQPALEARLF